jgi:hypothetical protein
MVSNGLIVRALFRMVRWDSMSWPGFDGHLSTDFPSSPGWLKVTADDLMKYMSYIGHLNYNSL